MASSSRKRSADPTWKYYEVPKAQRRGQFHAVPTVRSPHRPKPSLARPVEEPVAAPGTSSRYAAAPVLPPQPFTPAIWHKPHPDSKLCQDFHWVPYPLGLMPYNTWDILHNRSRASPAAPFCCPVCRSPRKTTPHSRKVFLVAERLTWEDGMVSTKEKTQNEELAWEVNYELGILDPFVEDPEHIPGGKKSQANQWHPYKNEYEMKQALDMIFVSQNITEATWAVWIGVQLDLQQAFGGTQGQISVSRKELLCSIPKAPLQPDSGNRTRLTQSETIDSTVSHDRSTPRQKQTFSGIPTPPSSFSKDGKVGDVPGRGSFSGNAFSGAQGKLAVKELTDSQPYFVKDRRISSYTTLQDFYSLLDQIERTSYVGALFLEAYAEHLQTDMCKDCWFKRYVDLEASQARSF